MDCKSCSSVNVCKVFTDIPVSPYLKNRVRQRLFSLVNHIDGYNPPSKNSIATNVIDDHNSYNSDHLKAKSKCIESKSQNIENVTYETSKKVHFNHESRQKPFITFENDSFEQEIIHKLENNPVNTDNNINDNHTSFDLCENFFTKPIYKANKDFFNINDQSSLASTIQTLKNKLTDFSEIITSLRCRVHMLEKENTWMKLKHQKEVEILKLLYESKMSLYQLDGHNKNIDKRVILNLLEEVKDLLTKSNSFAQHPKINSKYKNGGNLGSSSEIKRKLIDLKKKNAALKAETVRLNFEIQQQKKKIETKSEEKKTTILQSVIQKETPDSVVQVQDIEAYCHSLVEEYKEYMFAQIIEYKKALRYLRKKYEATKN